MAIFNSYVSLPEGKSTCNWHHFDLKSSDGLVVFNTFPIQGHIKTLPPQRSKRVSLHPSLFWTMMASIFLSQSIDCFGPSTALSAELRSEMTKVTIVGVLGPMHWEASPMGPWLRPLNGTNGSCASTKLP